jgi:hypothetical protein
VVSCSGAVGRADSTCDDSFSIGTSFVLAGARHVICSLWPVSKVASALIGRRFYENLAWMRGGLESAAPRLVDAPPRSVSECLLEAQRWYRGLGPPESHGGDAARLAGQAPWDVC